MRPRRILKTQLNTYIDVEHVEALQTEADEKAIRLSELVRRIIAAHLEAKNPRPARPVIAPGEPGWDSATDDSAIWYVDEE